MPEISHALPPRRKGTLKIHPPVPPSGCACPESTRCPGTGREQSFRDSPRRMQVRRTVDFGFSIDKLRGVTKPPALPGKRTSPNLIVFIVLLIVAALVGGAVLSGVAIWLYKQDREQKSTMRVLNANRQAALDLQKRSSDFWFREDPYENFRKSIGAIDLEGCPSDFQEAFLKYRQALERSQVSNADVVSLLINFRSTFASMDSRARDFQTAWQEVERVCLRHGIQFLTEKSQGQKK